MLFISMLNNLYYNLIRCFSQKFSSWSLGLCSLPWW